MTDLSDESKFAEESLGLEAMLTFKQYFSAPNFLNGQVFPLAQQSLAQCLIVINRDLIVSLIDMREFGALIDHSFQHFKLQGSAGFVRHHPQLHLLLSIKLKLLQAVCFLFQGELTVDVRRLDF